MDKRLSFAFIKREYIDSGKSPLQISKELGTYANEVRRAILKYGFKLRTRSEQLKLCAQNGLVSSPFEGSTVPEEVKEKIRNTLKGTSNKLSEQRKDFNRTARIPKTTPGPTQLAITIIETLEKMDYTPVVNRMYYRIEILVDNFTICIDERPSRPYNKTRSVRIHAERKFRKNELSLIAFRVVQLLEEYEDNPSPLFQKEISIWQERQQ